MAMEEASCIMDPPVHTIIEFIPICRKKYRMLSEFRITCNAQAIECEIKFSISNLPIHQVSRTTKLHTFVDSIRAFARSLLLAPFYLYSTTLPLLFFCLFIHKFKFYAKSVSGCFWLRLFGVAE